MIFRIGCAASAPEWELQESDLLVQALGFPTRTATDERRPAFGQTTTRNFVKS